MHRPLAWKSLIGIRSWPTVSVCSMGCRLLALGLLAALAGPGCSHEAPAPVASVSTPPTVQVITPPVRKIVRVVGQPSFIEAYERTAIYPKPTAYIEEWKVDIGDKVTKGQVLATLFVPELVEDYGTKQATVRLDDQRIKLALEVVKVANADVKAAQASLEEAKAIEAKFGAEVDRWDSEVKRLDNEVKRGIVDPQILLESTNQWKASFGRAGSRQGNMLKAKAELLSKEATEAKAKVDVAVARADLTVAKSETERLKAWVGYLTLHAPYDGVIVVRNANTGDFVLPTTGDPTAMEHAPRMSPGGAAPIYVVDRTDVVRVFVDIPEQDANYVQIGTKATVLAKAYRDEPIAGSVTRTSWALNAKSRTLRAEIDLKNPNSQLLPGMYAYAKVIIERPGVPALPLAALVLDRRPDLLLDAQERRSMADRDPDRRQRRQVDRGHQSPCAGDPGSARRCGFLDALRRNGTGHHGRPVDPRRWQPRAGRYGGGGDQTRGCHPCRCPCPCPCFSWFEKYFLGVPPRRGVEWPRPQGRRKTECTGPWRPQRAAQSGGARRRSPGSNTAIGAIRYAGRFNG